MVAPHPRRHPLWQLENNKLNAQTLPPFPEHGQRKLTAREQVERINAHACLVPDKLATQCEGPHTLRTCT